MSPRAFHRGVVFDGAELWQGIAVRRSVAVCTGTLLLACSLAACDDDETATGKARPPPAATTVEAQLGPAPKPEPAGSASSASPTAPAPATSTPAAGGDDEHELWSAGELEDVGPAGPAVASARGVALLGKDLDLNLAQLDGRAKPKAAGGLLGTIEQQSDHFVRLARRATVYRDHVYWVTRGKLLRVPLSKPKAEPEVLASDARDGTIVAAPPEEGGKGEPTAVVYIRRALKPEGPLHAKLWVEGRDGTMDLTPDGAATRAVSFARSSEALLLLSLEGRTGMTNLHARTVKLAKGKEPKVDLGDDTVVWVGGPAQPLTPLAALSERGKVFAFVPLEQDITHFGLARIEVGTKPSMGAEVIWYPYPNGLDPAPIATGEVCGGPVVVYARPADADPKSPQELHFAPFRNGKLGTALVVGRSRAFSTVSVAATASGGLVAYVADRRTWARTLTCKKPAK